MSLFFSSRRRHTRCALVTGFRRVLFRSAKVVTGLQAAMRQVDPDKVRTVLKELNIAFAGSGDDLDALLTNTEMILETLDTSWPRVENILKDENGKASCRERVCQHIELVALAV